MAATSLSPHKCWGRSPGLARPARMLHIRNGVPVSAARAAPLRRICPPPSPAPPSITSRFAGSTAGIDNKGGWVGFGRLAEPSPPL
eukprot:4992366-Pyramimonas_sp.AAC.1